MTELEKSVDKFIEKGFLFKDKNDEVHPFQKVKWSKKRLKLYLFWKEKIRKYNVVELDKKHLDAVFTVKNKDIIMSLRKRLEDVSNYKIIKLQKWDNCILIKYKLMVVLENEGSNIIIQTTIL